VLDPASGRFSVLSPSAALILARVDGSASIAEIASSIAAETGLTEGDLLMDVHDALVSMDAEGLIAFELTGDDSTTCASSSPASAPGADRSAAPALQPDRSAEAVRIGPIRIGATSAVVMVFARELVTALDDLLRLLPPGLPSEPVGARIAVSRAHDGSYDVRLDESLVATVHSAAAAVDAVLTACNRIASTRSVGAVRFHGGAVARDGRAIAICGVSGSGKSTLVAALVRQGWEYLTDEVVVVDALTGAVTAYPKWIDLAPDAVRLLGVGGDGVLGPGGRKHHLAPASIGSVGDSAQLEAIVLLGDDGAAVDDPVRRVSALDAVEELLAHVFASTFDGDDGLERVVDVCAGVPVGALPRGELDAMTASVDRWVNQVVRRDR